MSDKTSLEIFRDTLEILFPNVDDVIILKFLSLSFKYVFSLEELGEKTSEFLCGYKLAKKLYDENGDIEGYEYVTEKEAWNNAIQKRVKLFAILYNMKLSEQQKISLLIDYHANS